MNGTKRIHLKISLLYIEPEIWRRLVVPDSFSLGKLHEVIQVAMGWQNCHLHRFEIDDVSYTFENAAPEMNMKAEERTRLRDVLKTGVQAFLYEYDFGDSWLHQVIVEKTEDAESDTKPVCLAGEGACPPEDCGSYPGYEEILYALDAADPDEEQKGLLEWLGDMYGDYDPDYFDLEAVNRQLAGK